MKTINYQRGVGLIEVLVAMLVLSIGVLGFIALQYRAVEATLESTYRVQAINIARDLKNCFTENCTTAELADFDVAQVATRTRSVGMTMNVIECQGNSDGRNCVYVAWGDTSATDGTGEGDCTNSTAYNPASTCLIMELY